jgi:hypothetical protein
MNLTRRAVLDKALKSSVLCLGFSVGGVTLMLTPEQARAQKVELRTLEPQQVKILEALAEGLVPGSVKLGVTHFIDHQISVDPGESLLIAKYLQAPVPFAGFYAAGLKVAEGMAQRTAGKSLAALDASALEGLIKQMSKPGTVVDGYPIFLFYLCLRSDAVDVVYGTPEGFEKLNVPYMQHILPPEKWDA